MNTAERSILRAREAYSKYYSSRKNKAIKIIKHNEILKQSTPSGVLCRAVNLNGNPCQCRAVSNGLCKKHSIRT